MLDIKSKMTLDLESRRWRYAGAKEAHIRYTFGESATRYYQRLNALLENPDAMAYAPMTVKRLQRMRAARARLRATAPESHPRL